MVFRPTKGRIVEMSKMIFYAALQFYNSFMVLCQQIDKAARLKDEEKLGLIIPAVVQGALACELYMKGMIEGEPKIHKLNCLYDELNPAIQKFVSTLVIDVQRVKDASYNITVFRDDLKKYGDVFVDWRYFYEPGHGNAVDVNFMKDLASVLKSCAESYIKGVDFNLIQYDSMKIE